MRRDVSQAGTTAVRALEPSMPDKRREQVSTASWLKHLPVDYLRIDGTFFALHGADLIHDAMARAINQNGHVMGIHAVAQ